MVINNELGECHVLPSEKPARQARSKEQAANHCSLTGATWLMLNVHDRVTPTSCWPPSSGHLFVSNPLDCYRILSLCFL